MPLSRPAHARWLERAEYDLGTAEAMVTTGMAYSTDDALKVARGFLGEAASRHRIRHAFLFGSCVWGQPTPYSDIDLAVVLEAAPDTKAQGFGEAFEIFHEAQEYNSALEVVCFTVEEFRDETSALVRRIKKHGSEVPLRVEETQHPIP